ncbi:MAG: AAA family ATPase, partial [Kofleriaceae bacterium]
MEHLYQCQGSVVDRAVRIADGLEVVLKQPLEPSLHTQREYEVLEAVRGEGVVEVIELVQTGDQVALVVESFGEPFAQSLARGRLALAEALAIASAVTRALARVHAAGFIHRDLNPNSLVYDPLAKVVKIIDFGIAASSRTAPDAPHDLEGTVRYMAPEQTGRLNRRVDQRSDLYSLGVMLYELFTGVRPFEGDNALAIIHGHLASQPPRIDEVDPAIPRPIASIVARLLAKTPEHRYQTAAGLLADLERCLGADFVLGAVDVSRFELPDRIYGRDREVRTLLDAFRRTAAGGIETVAVGGYSGVGKSALVRETYATITLVGGRVASGKFDRLTGDAPFAALAIALSDLIVQLFAEVGRTHARLRADIIAAVGNDGALVVTAVPALARVIGAQPPPPSLDPEVAHHRLLTALTRVMQVFTHTQHPLVLFLDDMQWADAATLQLLSLLVQSELTESLLLVLAYRDNEVDAAHPLEVALRGYETAITRIALAPLPLAATEELLADVLHASPPRAVTEAIWRKTDGNPFFLRQFLTRLHADGLIAFDPERGCFAIDASKLDTLGISENVADLLADGLNRLPASTRELLTTAAAIGNRFDVATLAMVDPRDLQPDLTRALEAGLVMPAGSGCFVFQHDRVQQAAYELIPINERAYLHRAIGRTLLASVVDPTGDRLFEITHHLNAGSAQLEPAEHGELVRLDLVAARRARRAGAFDVAVGLLRCARAIAPWTHAGCHALHVELAEVLALAGQPEQARTVVHEAIEHASGRERVVLESVDTAICINVGRFDEAIACCRRGAALIGVALPTDPLELARGIEVDIRYLLAQAMRGPIERLLERPIMTDPDQLVAVAVFVNAFPAAYQVEPALLGLLSAKVARLAIEHGNCSKSARGYVSVAIVFWRMGRYDVAFQYGWLAVELVRKLGATDVQTSTEFVFASLVSPWQRPINESIAILRQAVPSGIAHGDAAHTGYSALFLVAMRLFRGDPLTEVVEEARSFHDLATRYGLVEIAAAVRWYPWQARVWTGAAG